MRNYRARGVTKSGKPIFSEAHEQMVVAQWLDAHGINFIHVPNGEHRHKVVAKKLKKMGVKPGAPDFLIFDPPSYYRLIVGTALELKALDGKGPTDEQTAFLQSLKSLFWITACIRGSDAAIKWLEELGYGNHHR